MTTSRLTLNMIIVSGSSAEATQPVRTGRYTPARRRSSAPHNDTPRYANAWSISVHTEEHNRFKINNPVPPAGLAPGWSPAPAVRVVGTRVARVSRRVGAEGVAGQAQGSRSFSRRVLHLDPCAPPLQDEPADATGYPLQPHPSARAKPPSCCPRAVRKGQLWSAAVPQGAVHRQVSGYHLAW